MSDYLSHLAARTTDTAVTIRPRLASYYESPAMTASTPESETAAMSAEAESRPVRATEKSQEGEPQPLVIVERREGFPTQSMSAPPPAETPVVPKEAARALEAAEHPRLEPRTVLPPPAVQESTAKPERPRHTAPEPRRTQPAPSIVVERVIERIREVPAAPVEAPRRTQPTPSIAVEHVIERIREGPAAPVEHSAVHQPAVPISPMRTAESPATVPPIAPRFQEEPRRREPLQTPPTITPKLPTKVIAEPRMSRHRPLPPSELVMKTDHAAAPDIQVTIGRIEVRAVPAAEPPARRAAAATNPMSLDDYLRRRSESAKR